MRLIAFLAAMIVMTPPAQTMEVKVPKDPVVSAEVVFAPASGAALENAAITAANVKAFAPAPEAVEAARRYFTQAGFQTSSLSGISFTISAPQSVFETTFGVKLAGGKKSASKKASAASKAPVELPLARLPASVSKGIKAVTFSRPPDYGPTGSYSD
jgi:subtilase family serine protease